MRRGRVGGGARSPSAGRDPTRALRIQRLGPRRRAIDPVGGCNQKRRHSALDYVSPGEYERTDWAALAA